MTIVAPKVEACRLIALPRNDDAHGCLTVLESYDAVPFDVKRVFTIAGVPAGASRGGHANSRTQELLVCLAGAVTVRARDGASEWCERLSADSDAAYLPPMVWVDLLDFQAGTVLVVLTDTPWADACEAYYRDEASWRSALETIDAL